MYIYIYIVYVCFIIILKFWYIHVHPMEVTTFDSHATSVAATPPGESMHRLTGVLRTGLQSQAHVDDLVLTRHVTFLKGKQKRRNS